MKLNIVYWGDDWMGLYKDGELILEDHSLRPQEIFNVLGFEYYVNDMDSNTPEEIQWDGCPSTFEDAKKWLKRNKI